MARIAAGHPRVSGPGRLLFGEADDACDFTARRESPAFDLPCVSRDRAEESGGTADLKNTQMFLCKLN